MSTKQPFPMSSALRDLIAENLQTGAVSPQEMFETLDREIGERQMLMVELGARYNIIPTNREVRDVVLAQVNQAMTTAVRPMLDLAVRFSPTPPDNYHDAVQMVRDGVERWARVLDAVERIEKKADTLRDHVIGEDWQGYVMALDQILDDLVRLKRWADAPGSDPAPVEHSAQLGLNL